MDASMHVARGRMRPYAGIALALLVIACVDPSQAPTPRPSSVEPTASPVEPTAVPAEAVLDRFEAILADESFTAHIRYEIEVSIGKDGLSSVAEIDLAGSDSATTLEYTGLDGKPGSSELVAVDGRSFSRTPGGPWIEADRRSGEPASSEPASAEPSAAPDPIDWIRGGVLEPAGQVERDGRLLYRFSGDGTEAVRDVLATRPGAPRDVASSLEMILDVDGRPAEAVVTFSWRQDSGDEVIDVDGRLSLEFSEIGEPKSIVAPTDIWVVHESEVDKFSMAHPDGWLVLYEDELTRMIAPDGKRELRVVRSEVRHDLTQAEWLAGQIANYEATAGVTPDSQEPVEVAGASTKILTYHLRLGGEDKLFLDAPVKPESLAFDIQWLGPAVDETDARRIFGWALTTLTIDEPCC